MSSFLSVFLHNLRCYTTSFAASILLRCFRNHLTSSPRDHHTTTSLDIGGIDPGLTSCKIQVWLIFLAPNLMFRLSSHIFLLFLQGLLLNCQGILSEVGLVAPEQQPQMRKKKMTISPSSRSRIKPEMPPPSITLELPPAASRPWVGRNNQVFLDET